MSTKYNRLTSDRKIPKFVLKTSINYSGKGNILRFHTSYPPHILNRRSKRLQDIYKHYNSYKSDTLHLELEYLSKMLGGTLVHKYSRDYADMFDKMYIIELILTQRNDTDKQY